MTSNAAPATKARLRAFWRGETNFSRGFWQGFIGASIIGYPFLFGFLLGRWL